MSVVPSPREAAAFAYDEVAQCGYLFGGNSNEGDYNEVWKWKDGEWSGPLAVGLGPPPLKELKAFYDPMSKVTLVTGGTVEGDFRDQFVRQLWLWNGSWRKLEILGAIPPGRFNQSLAFDSKRGRLVLYGGNGPDSADQDTWEFDGVTWKRIAAPSPVEAPSRRDSSLMAFDATREVVVLLGGHLQEPDYLSNYETWEWDGIAWTQRASAPLGFHDHRDPTLMVYDARRQRVVSFGTECTMEWDGVSWVEFDGNPRLLPQNSSTLFDPVRQSIVSFGGRFGISGEWRATNKIWERSGTEWKLPPLEPVRTVPLNLGVVTEDLSSGTIWALEVDTSARRVRWLWRFDGFSWQGPLTLPGMIQTGRPAIAYDTLHSKLLVFGGEVSSMFPNPNTLDPSLWSFDGASWGGPVTQANGPGGRDQHVLQYMEHSSAMMMFGGLGTTQHGRDEKRDTWMSSGHEWILVAAAAGAVAPTAQRPYASAYQVARKRVLLFGNEEVAPDGLSQLTSTWEFDGATWKLRDTAHRPPAMSTFALAYDGERGRVVLVGSVKKFGAVAADEGVAESAHLNEDKQTWEWDGIDWSRIRDAHGNSAPVPTTNEYRLVYSAAHRKVLWLGRGRGLWYAAETWAWDGTRWSQLAV